MALLHCIHQVTIRVSREDNILDIATIIADTHIDRINLLHLLIHLHKFFRAHLLGGTRRVFASLANLSLQHRNLLIFLL